MRSRLLWIRLLLGLVLIALPFGSVRSQGLSSGTIEFEAKARPTRLLRQDLFKGLAQANPTNPQHQEAAEIAAKEIIYYLDWDLIQGRANLPPGKISNHVNDFETRLFQMSKFRANTLAFQKMFTRAAIDAAQEVMLKSKPISAVNAARCLSLIPARRMERGVAVTDAVWFQEAGPRLADGNAEHLATACLTVLNNPKTNDGVRYYLYRTLTELLGLPQQSPPLLSPATIEKICKVAIAQVEKKVAFPKATPRQEVEGYKMLRLQAVATLAQAGLPTTPGKDRPALVLARVAGSDESIVPTPRLDERVEAVIGLARMGQAAATVPEFNIDTAMEQVCRSIHQFNVQANENLESKPTLRFHPWKVSAARMGEALELMKTTVKDPYTQNAIGQCLPILTGIERGTSPAATIKDWLSTNPPTNKTVFKGDESTAIKTLDKDA